MSKTTKIRSSNTKKPTDELEMLSTGQISRLIGVSPPVIRKLIHSNQLQAKKVGREFRVARWQLREWQAESLIVNKKSSNKSKG